MHKHVKLASIAINAPLPVGNVIEDVDGGGKVAGSIVFSGDYGRGKSGTGHGSKDTSTKS